MHVRMCVCVGGCGCVYECVPVHVVMSIKDSASMTSELVETHC